LKTRIILWELKGQLEVSPGRAKEEGREGENGAEGRTSQAMETETEDEAGEGRSIRR